MAATVIKRVSCSFLNWRQQGVHSTVRADRPLHVTESGRRTSLQPATRTRQPVITDDFRQFLESMLVALAALLPIVNPLGAAPVYLAKTIDLTASEHADLARRVALNCFILLLASLLIGAYVLDFFGLSVPIVHLAGGLLVCSLAWSLLHQPDEPIEWVHEAANPIVRPDLRSRAFYPLTMPLTVGPGSISVAITIGANQSQSVRSMIVNSAANATGIRIVSIAVFGVRRYAHPPMRHLRPAGPPFRSPAPASPLSLPCAALPVPPAALPRNRAIWPLGRVTQISPLHSSLTPLIGLALKLVRLTTAEELPRSMVFR